MIISKKQYSILVVPLLALCIAFVQNNEIKKEVMVISYPEKTTFIAGDQIELVFSTNTPAFTQLFLHTSYGSTVLISKESAEVSFVLPEYMAKKRGEITFQLWHESILLHTGKIMITIDTQAGIVSESYIGPPSITAGGKDSSMFIEIPTDPYDNTLPDSTLVHIKHQFMDKEVDDEVFVHSMIAWKNMYSYEKSGRILMSSKTKKTSSKEFSLEVFPALATDFTIEIKRKHQYADGNQITEFYTATLKDQYGNIVSDGTQVEFVIKNQKGTFLRTVGSTINGIARGKILHPDHQDFWEVKAYVIGSAESNTLGIEYKAIAQDYPIKFTNDNRKIIVGPILSFMEQRIPDGVMVVLKIYNEDEYIDTKAKTTTQGEVEFLLSEGFYPSGNYNFTIKALGIEKELKEVSLK